MHNGRKRPRQRLNYKVLSNKFEAPDKTQEFDKWEIDGKRVEPGTEIKLEKDNTEIKALWKK